MDSILSNWVVLFGSSAPEYQGIMLGVTTFILQSVDKRIACPIKINLLNIMI